MGFPFEIITMLGSTVLGGVMSVGQRVVRLNKTNKNFL